MHTTARTIRHRSGRLALRTAMEWSLPARFWILFDAVGGTIGIVFERSAWKGIAGKGFRNVVRVGKSNAQDGCERPASIGEIASASQVALYGLGFLAVRGFEPNVELVELFLLACLVVLEIRDPLAQLGRFSR